MANEIEKAWMEVIVRGGSFKIDVEDALAFVGVPLYIGSNGYVRNDKLYLHRMIMGASNGQQVDHANGDRLDNRRSNLRFSTQAQNMWNVPVKGNNKSGVLGVHWSTKVGKWCAQITINKKTLTLGHFSDLDEAAAVRRDAEITYQKEFAACWRRRYGHSEPEEVV